MITQLPTQVIDCVTGAVLGVVNTATVFPIGTSCVLFRFQDAAGNVGVLARHVKVIGGANTSPSTPDVTIPIPGFLHPDSATVDFEGGVTAPGITTARCLKSGDTAPQQDFEIEFHYPPDFCPEGHTVGTAATAARHLRRIDERDVHRAGPSSASMRATDTTPSFMSRPGRGSGKT